MKFIISLFLLSCLHFSAFAQASEHVFGLGNARSVIPTPDGGVLVSGQRNSVSDNRRCFLKFDAAGFLSIMKSHFDQLEFNSTTVDAAILPGGYLLGGMMFHDTISNDEISLLKCDESGNVVWSKRYGNPLKDDVVCKVLASNDVYLIAGYTKGYGPGGEDFLLMKTDTMGNLVWAKTYGSLLDDKGIILREYSGGYYFGGYSTEPSGKTDLFMLQISLSGTLVSMTQIVMPGNQVLNDLNVNSDGSILLTATTDTGTVSPQALFVKLTPTGSLIWIRILNGSLAIPYQTIETATGFISTGVIFQSAQRENSFFLEFDASGNFIRNDFFGDSLGCITRSFCMKGDTIIATGQFIIPALRQPAIYMNRFIRGDTSCNSFTGNLSMGPVNASSSSPSWVTSSPAIPVTDAVVIAFDEFTTDTNVCDLTPGIMEIPGRVIFEVAPNPASEKITITFRDPAFATTITIFNSSGMLVYESQIWQKSITFDIHRLSPGMYTIQVKNKTGYGVQKLVLY